MIHGSDGNPCSTNTLSLSEGEDAPFWDFVNNATGPSSLGTHANQATASISEYENAPVELIASFKAA